MFQSGKSFFNNEKYRAITLLIISIIFILSQGVTAQQKNNSIKFEISCAEGLKDKPITGRLFLLVSKDSLPEPRLQRRPSPPLFGVDVSNFKPGETVEINSSTPGYPAKSLSDFTAGEYYVQAVLNVYTQVHRADGHTIWVHMDQWEGQKFNISPGNLVSRVYKVKLGPAFSSPVKMLLNDTIPQIKLPEDTKWVKHIKIKSELLTKFWGYPFYLGATMLLPKGYDEHPDVYYPVEYEQTHFTLEPSHGFNPVEEHETEAERARRLRNSDETGYEFYNQWVSDDFPRMICINFQHPTPYYDDSYAVNSANNGPFGDAIMTELIPYIEDHFRIIKEPYARILSGGSTGGWEALALQVYHPDFFGGSFVFYPDPVDFRCYGIVDIYNDGNAFSIPTSEWGTEERPYYRANNGQTYGTLRNQSYVESVLGSKGRSCEQLNIWEAVYGPTDKEGYPAPLWSPTTGVIDHSVAQYMKEHNYDLREYMERNWKELGPKLKGKLRFFCGDMDNLFLNLGVYKMEEFLSNTKDPYYEGSFEYGRPLKGHGWRPVNNAELVKMIGEKVLKNTPEGNLPAKWIYK